MRTAVKSWAMLLTLAACQPTVDVGDESEDVEDAWMLGIWSAGLGPGVRNVSYIEIQDGGVLLKTGLGACGKTDGTPTEYQWKPSGPDSIQVMDLDGTPMGDWHEGPTLLAFRDVCDERGSNEYLDHVYMRDGDEVIRNEGTYIRGRVCLYELPPPDDPSGFEWDDCRADWCEGEPPTTLPCLP